MLYEPLRIVRYRSMRKLVSGLNRGDDLLVMAREKDA
jgi:hypothetical protein